VKRLLQSHPRAAGAETRVGIVSGKTVCCVPADVRSEKEGNVMAMVPGLLLQTEGGATAGALVGSTIMIVMLAIMALFIIAMWRVFAKAGQPGWAVLIPIYNLYILLKIAGKPGWWILLCMIPLVNIVIIALVSIAVAKAFGQSAAFGVILLFLLCGIGYLMLGFGSSRYVGTAAAAAR
jgi:hypothetical protein